MQAAPELHFDLLNHVQEWATKRLETLRHSLDVAVRALDFSDDRLARLLDMLGDDRHWMAFEASLNQRTLRVYDLQAERVRIDSTTASGYWQVSEEGLFQLGHSKEHRPDLPQLKVVLATLDPLGMPVATQVVAGNRADDPLYLPAIEQVRQGLGRHGLLYVGDSKMMSLETRTYLQVGGDYYLGPFSLVQVPQETLQAYLQAVWSGQQPLVKIERQNAEGQLETIAEGYEIQETLTMVLNGQEVTWSERRLIVRSFAYAQAAETALRKRLEKAERELKALNERKQGKRRLSDETSWKQAIEEILKRHQVEGLLEVELIRQVHERQVRKYGERPAGIRLEEQFLVSVRPNESAIGQVIRGLGWRIYGTNAPAEVLSLEQAVLAYREEDRVERNFGRLKGKPLSLTPMYLQDDRRATGLTRLLSIGLRVLSLIEHVLRTQLAKRGEKLSGLYAGNPKRATDHPTTEAVLRAFKDIFLNLVCIGEQRYSHITPLSELQKRILDLLNLPSSIYSTLAVHSANPP